MISFHIEKPEIEIQSDLKEKINHLSKPLGSLGTLENLAIQVGWIQQTLTPKLRNPYNIIFAGDHGIVYEGVSLSPQEVTRQMISNFLTGGAGINFLARQHGFTIKVVDAGINHDFPVTEGLEDRKIAKGTRNFLYEAAMTPEEAHLALQAGAEVVDECFKDGCNVVSFGEMGIGNTSAASMWMSCMAGIPLKKCIGSGCGLDPQGVKHKYTVLKKALKNYKGDFSTFDLMCYFGGYEMVMAVGAMLRAAERKMIILVDGFIMGSCIMAASKLHPEILHYAVFGHQSEEAGHKLLLNYLGVKPLLHLQMRLGEGTGAVCAYPIVDSAVRMINEMNTFDSARVTKYF